MIDLPAGWSRTRFGAELVDKEMPTKLFVSTDPARPLPIEVGSVRMDTMEARTLIERLGEAIAIVEAPK